MRSLVLLLLVAASVEARPPQAPRLPQVMLPTRCDCSGAGDCVCGSACECAACQADPLVKCCDGSTHRLSEWKGRPLEYPSAGSKLEPLGAVFRRAGAVPMGFTSCGPRG